MPTREISMTYDMNLAPEFFFLLFESLVAPIFRQLLLFVGFKTLLCIKQILFMNIKYCIKVSHIRY